MLVSGVDGLADHVSGGAIAVGNTTADWTIAYWHHPPYTKGTHNSDNVFDSGGRMHVMREKILPMLFL